MTHAENVRASVRNALQGNVPEQIIESVKTTVAHELGALSPDAEIRFTEYFDHTFMPDMTLTWGSGKSKRARPVFVRAILDPEAARRDIDQLSDRSPVFLDLDQIDSELEHDPEVRTAISEQARDVLVAEISAVASIAEPSTLESVADTSSSEALYDLVRHNILPGGRGLLGDIEAERLRDTVRIDDGPAASTGFEATIRSLFASDAALRLRRSGDILVWTMDPDIVEHPQLSGRLSEDEIRTLLPILLRNDRARGVPSFWAMIGSMMDFETFEGLPEAFAGVDLTPLIAENLEQWASRRVQVSLNADYDDDGYEPELEGWSLSGGILRLSAGPWHLSYATDSRRLKGRPRDGVAARWADISGLLSEYDVESVELRGVARTVVISAEQSSNVKRDVDQIHALLEDSFQVTDMMIKHRESAEQVSLDIEFPEMVLTAEHPESLLILTHAGLTLLGRSRPVAID